MRWAVVLVSANLLGALGGGVTIGTGLGVPSTASAGFALTAAGLFLFATSLPRVRRTLAEAI